MFSRTPLMPEAHGPSSATKNGYFDDGHFHDNLDFTWLWDMVDEWMSRMAPIHFRF
jgi:hypothetical protein